VTLGVTDLPASTAFYEQIGLQRHPRSNAHITFFEMSGQILALFGADALAEDAGVQQRSSGFAGMTLAHNVNNEDEVQSLIDRAVDAGGTRLRPVSEPPWGGQRGYFADLDGHVWEVAWNPNISLDADGRIAF